MKCPINTSLVSLGILTFGFAAPAFAAPPAEAPPLAAPTSPGWTIEAFTENDSATYKPERPTDRHYTSGQGVAVLGQPDFARDMTAWFPFASAFGPGRVGAGFVLAQQIFTPSDINLEDPPKTDRPYAGYLYGGFFWQRSTPTGAQGFATQDHFQLDLGVVGPSALGEQAQNWIHDLFDYGEAKGWAHQIKDEPTIQFTFRKKWKLPLITTAPQEAFAFGIDMIPSAGFQVGTVYRNIEIGDTLRIGFNLPDNFGPAHLTDPGDATWNRANGSGLSAFGFARVGGRAVEHNTLVEGSNFRAGRGVTANPLVGEVQLGASVGYYAPQWAVEIIYAQTFVTEEFRDQHGSDGYGAFTLAATMQF
jgi:lipid A 3-O-deacylase